MNSLVRVYVVRCGLLVAGGTEGNKEVMSPVTPAAGVLPICTQSSPVMEGELAQGGVSQRAQGTFAAPGPQSTWEGDMFC